MKNDNRPIARMGFLWQNRTMLGRWIRFFIAIAFGTAAGVGYGWLVAPPPSDEHQASNLRIDYQSDVVLMIAEAYAADQNLAAAIARLSFLKTSQPTEIIQQAVNFGERYGYSDGDLQKMRALLAAVETLTPLIGTRVP
ncbi:MAG: hypothetical protein N3D16_03035 [Anaerolineales bacterium]|nr:hypothetical protein [Anaerolineales bacterium]